MPTRPSLPVPPGAIDCHMHIYGPPEHLDGIVQSTKAEADRRHPHEEWDGKTTE